MARANFDSNSYDAERERERAEERERIFERYTQGRSRTDDIEPWEEPNFSHYMKKDRYGFIHEKPIPMEPLDKKSLEKKQIKEKKWLRMVKHWQETNRVPEDLKSRIWKGCPDSLRGQVWPLMLRIREIKQSNEKTHGPNMYERMKEKARRKSPDIRQIDLDVHRTYRNHEMFQLKYGVMQQKLFYVLAGYSMFNKEVGYCQGMANVVALMLMYLHEEEDAFWALTSLLRGERYKMNDFFTPRLPKLFRCLDHHMVLRKKFIPSVHKHLKKLQYEPTLYATKWFLQCYLDKLPFSLALRVWDIFLLEGEEIETAMAIAILRTFKKTLIKQNDEQLNDFLCRLCESQLDEEKIIDNLSEVLLDLRRQRMSHLPKEKIIEELKPSESLSTLPSNKKVKKKKKNRDMNNGGTNTLPSMHMTSL